MHPHRPSVYGINKFMWFLFHNYKQSFITNHSGKSILSFHEMMIFNPVGRNNNLNAVRYFLCTGILLHHFGYLTDIAAPDLFKY